MQNMWRGQKLNSINPKKISKKTAWIVLILIALIVGVPSSLYGLPMEPLFFLSWLIIIPICLKLGYKFKDIEMSAVIYCEKAMSPIFVMFAVGAMMGVWIAAGTVPTIIFYGLKIISPKYFLVLSFLICSVVSFITGTSWGTIGTAGLAMSSIGFSLGISPGLVVGAVVSGSLFGDATSIMSASNNLVASVSETELMDHVKYTLKTILPMYIITLIIYLVLGFKYGSAELDNVFTNNLMNLIADKFNISFIALIPLIALLILLALKKPALISIMIGVVIGGLVAVIYQGYSFVDIINISWEGFVSNSGEVFLDTLLNRGGIISMFRLVSIFIFTFGLIGMLNKAEVIETALEPLFRVVNSKAKLICMTVVIGIISDIVAGSMNVSIVMTATALLPLYKKLNVPLLKLSSIVSLVCILGSALVPWNTNGVFITSVIEVDTWTYLPYSYLNILAPILIVLFALFKVKRKKSREKVN